MALKRVVNLHASWCGPCKNFESTFNRVASAEKNKDIIFERVDIESDNGTELVEKFSVRSVPTTILLDENEESLMKIMGSVPESDLQMMIDRNR